MTTTAAPEVAARTARSEPPGTRANTHVLDVSLARLRDGEYRTGLDGLFGGLLDLREELPAQDWRTFAKVTAPAHPIRTYLHLDPVTRRSFERPRGYPGDAVLLDYLYRIARPDASTGPAHDICRHVVGRPAAQSVRYRRSWIADRIDTIAAERPAPIRVMSIAAGHLREGHLSDALRGGAVEELVALDSDRASCAVVDRLFPAVTTRHAPFTSILRNRQEDGRYDFVYSAGLFDYLDTRTGTLLTRRMFDLLRPGGSLLLTNFLPSTVDAGYMESFMGWDLIYRSREDLRHLTRGIPAEQVASTCVHADSRRAIGYLEVTRD